jgi:type I pantothenate kinase
MERKGFPESYDRRALLRFVTEVKAGKPRVVAPMYSHLTYDIVAGEHTVTHRPDILLLEGLNVLQPAPAGAALVVSDFIDFSVYVDAAADDIRRWYVERFLRLRETAFRDPSSYFRRYAGMDEAAATARAEQIWAEISLLLGRLGEPAVAHLAEYRGFVQYYLLAGDVWRLHRLHWVMQTSMLKTLGAP